MTHVMAMSAMLLAVKPIASTAPASCHPVLLPYKCKHNVQGFDGKHGLAITTDSSSTSAACMAQSAIGDSNHFGYTSRKGSCLSVESGSALASESFSCVCLFSSTPSAVEAGTVSSSSLG